LIDEKVISTQKLKAQHCLCGKNVALNSGVSLFFMWLLLSYQRNFETVHNFCNQPVQ